MKITLKKKILIIVAAILFIILGYIGLHLYGNYKIISNYAKGYETSNLGGYYKNEGDYVFAVLPISMVSMSTNLSLANSKGNIDLVIWMNIFGNVNKMGLIINTGNAMEQVYIKPDFTAIDKDDRLLLEKNSKEIKKLQKLVADEWNL